MRGSKFKILLSLFIVFWLTGVGAVSAETYYVPGDYSSIQDAVNESSNGDTIIVKDGNYAENVEIKKELTLKSENGSANCVVEPDSWHGIISNANNVTIEGFTVKNADIGIDVAVGYSLNDIKNNTVDGCNQGIHLESGSERNNISNNVLRDNTQGIHLTGSVDNNIAGNVISNNNQGFWLQSNSNSNFIFNNTVHHNFLGITIRYSENNVVKQNNVYDNEDKGIYIFISLPFYQAMNTSVIDNTVRNNTYGIYLGEFANNNLVLSNTVYDNDQGIFIETDSNLIESNTVYNNRVGVNIHGSSLFASSSGNSVLSNTIYSNPDFNIRVEDGDYNLIEWNNIHYSSYGIYFTSSPNNEVYCNWIHDNNRGIYLNGDSMENKINFNNIIRNGVYNSTSGGYEWQLYNDQGVTVNATKNYWNQTTNETIDASIYDDEEGKEEVYYYPSLSSPAPCAPVPELPTMALLAVGLLGMVLLGRRNR